MGRHAYKFTAQRQKDYLELLADGKRRGSAAHEVGLDSKTIDRHIALDPAFMELREAAESRADDEVEESLFESARSGNVPAAKMWLEARRPNMWKPQEKPLLGSSPAAPLHIALPGQIDWNAIPDDLADRFLALNAELVALQPASGGMVVNQDGSPAEDDAPEKPFMDITSWDEVPNSPGHGYKPDDVDPQDVPF